MIQLAVFDVDGTLLPKGKEIPVSAIEAIKDLQQNGILVAIASGRSIYTLQKLDEAGIVADYYICCNGHCIYDCHRNLVGGTPFTKEQVDILTDYCNAHDYPLLWKFSMHNYLYRGIEVFREAHQLLGFDPSLSVDCPLQNHHEVELPFGAVVHVPENEVEGFADCFDLVPFASGKYDVTVKGVSKGLALRQLTDMLKLSLDECIAFGDALNDYEMIQEAGLGVAMKDCVTELLAVCDYQTDSCLHDGVAKALLYYGLIDEICTQ